MIHWKIRNYWVVFCWLSVWGCATVVAPEGGERDEVPPELIEEKSTENFQTNFKPQRIELTFNEWVKLQDWKNQVVISPPLGSNDYELKLKGKMVRVAFEEDVVFREEATYTVNFGEAVQDLNEGNPAENLRFVFATGAILDSLRVNCRVVNVETNEPVEGALVLLYENRSDTVVRTERPFYFGKTTEEGTTTIENIRADTFKVAVLVDSGNNYLFDKPTQEQFGFLDSFLLVSAQLRDTVRLKMFSEEIPLRLNDDETENYGIVKLVFNRLPYDLDSLYTDKEVAFIREQDKDTLKLWYAEPPEGNWKVFARIDTSLIDTVDIKSFEEVELDSLQLSKSPGKTFNPTLPVTLVFNYPVLDWDTSKVTLLADTLRRPIVPEITKDTMNPRVLNINARWKEGETYELTLLPNAITDLLGQHNDTIRLDLKASLLKEFGNIKLKVEGLDTLHQYVIQLLDGERVAHVMIAKEVSTFQETLETIKPGSYTLKVITDWNENQKWDTGNYDLQLQPEPIFLKKLEQLRANWDLEVEARLK